MKPTRAIRALWLAALLPAVLLLSTPTARAADLEGMAYLARISADARPDTVTVRLRIRGAAVPSVAYRPGLVQITLEDAFLDPAKQRVAVDHPAVSEVVAYQLDPETVRVRILTPGIDARDLADTAVLTPEPGGLRLVLRGLPAPEPAPAAQAPVPPDPAHAAPPEAPARKPRKAPVVIVRAETPPELVSATASEGAPRARPEAPAPVGTAESLAPGADSQAPFPPAGVDTALAAAQARTQALEAFEHILAEHAEKPGKGGVRPAPANEVAWLADVRPDEAPQGGGSPALAAPPLAVTPAAPEAPKPVEGPAPKPTPQATPAAPHAAGAGDGLAGSATRTPLAPLPSASAAPTLFSSGIKMAGGLLTVLALLLAGVTLLRRVRGTAFGGAMPIRVLASASVGGRQNIVVVEVEGRRLVVGVGPGGMELLADLATGAPADATGPAVPSQGAPTRPAPAPGRGETRFGRLLKAAGRKTASAVDPDAEAVARATRDLARHVRRLKERAV